MKVLQQQQLCLNSMPAAAVLCLPWLCEVHTCTHVACGFVLAVNWDSCDLSPASMLSASADER